MTLANVPLGPAKNPSERAWRLGESLKHGTVLQFTLNKWWQTLCGIYGLLSAFLGYHNESIGILSLGRFDLRAEANDVTCGFTS